MPARRSSKWDWLDWDEQGDQEQWDDTVQWREPLPFPPRSRRPKRPRPEHEEWSLMANQNVDAISVGPNTIYIRRKLNFGQTSRIESAAVLAAQEKGNLILTLMEVYMDRWEGPAFQGINSVAEMDPDEPVVEQAHDEIAKRYGARLNKESPDPN